MGLFAAEGGGDLDEGGNGNRDDAASHHPPEEVDITHRFLEPSGSHAGKHHAESHEAGAYRIVGRAERAFTKVDEIEHIGREAESVTKLLDKYTGIDRKHIGRLHNGQITECAACERDAPRHRPNPLLEAAVGCHEAADDASECKSDNAYGAVDKSHLRSGEAKSSRLA